MKCSLCNVEASITKTFNRVEGDNSPYTETKVYTVQEMSCRNKNCDNYNKVIAVVEHQLNIQ
jgi:hypothetical protein